MRRIAAPSRDEPKPRESMIPIPDRHQQTPRGPREERTERGPKDRAGPRQETGRGSRPERRLFPPAFTLTTVRIVAPAPGMPPISPATMFPTPWPKSSRLLSCRVRVRLSATSEVSSESIAPSRASWSGGEQHRWQLPKLERRQHQGRGRPEGISPISGTSSFSHAASSRQRHQCHQRGWNDLGDPGQ